MTTTPDQLFAYLDGLGIAHPTISWGAARINETLG